MVLSARSVSRKQNLIGALLNALLVPPLVALLVSAAVIALLARTRAASLVLDHPNQRSLHAQPTLRVGGIGILAGIAVGWSLLSLPFDARLLAALATLAAISLLDDLWSVPVVWRLAVHLAAAALAMTALLQPAYGLWAVVLAALFATWMINLYNFMDGSDGLAGGMAVIGFGIYGVAALIGGDYLFAAVNAVVAGAALGFLWFNFPPARVFMGDAGAIPLGYLAAVLDVMGWLRGDWPLWFGAVVFSPFIVDASVTLCKRAARGARVWQAHREHYFQRLVQAGWGHRKTALAEYALMAACGAASLATARYEALQVPLGVAVLLVYVVLIFALERAVPRHA
jgi:UDP-N-acetylmuramyl pentapeptide phosphotransferase/UDP-N-acetylglucosamine-1-phosphate transferase